MMRSVKFEEARRNPDFEVGSEALHRNDRGMIPRGTSGSEQALVFSPAEVRTFEQFWRQDHFCVLAGGLADEVAYCADVLVRVFGK